MTGEMFVDIRIPIHSGLEVVAEAVHGDDDLGVVTASMQSVG
jgi:hypothetical protein